MKSPDLFELDSKLNILLNKLFQRNANISEFALIIG